MPLRIVNKNSTVQDKAPLAADLQIGEIAVNANVNSPAAYIKDSAGNIVKIAGSGSVGDDWSRTGTALFPKTTGDTIQFSAGTAALPGVTPVGDTNTGIYSPGADQLALSTNGTQRLLIDASGNVNIDSNTLYVDATNNRVGIGTSSPLTPLHVAGSNGITVTTGSNNARIYGEGTSKLGFAFASSDGTTVSTAKATLNLISDYTSSRAQFLIGRTHSATTPSYSFIDDSNTGIVGGADADVLGINTGGVRALTIDSSQRVGIGTTSPSSLLHVQDAGVTTLIVANTSNSSGVELSGSSTTGEGIVRSRFNNSQLVFATAGASGGAQERVRIDSAGRLLVGTSTSVGNGNALQVYPSSNNSIAAFFAGASSGGVSFDGFRAQGSKGSESVVLNGNGLLRLRAYGYSGAAGDYVQAGSIDFEVDGTPDSAGDTTDMPGRLVFSTTADGASSPTEAMRITSAQAVIVGGTSTDVDFHIGSTLNYLKHDINGTSSVTYSRRATTASAEHIRFANSNGDVGSIDTSGSATSYNTSSDYRLKENVTAVTDGITRLQQLKPSRFNFIVDPGTVVDGFIAHEVQAVVPEAITGEKDAVDDEGNPVYQGIDQSKLVPLLTAALQEAIAKIESLEARLDAASL